MGYSGHAYVAMEVAMANGLNILGYFDKLENKSNPFNIPYCGYEEEANFKALVKDSIVFPALGSNSIRKKLYQKLSKDNIKQIVLADPSANISSSATIGESTLINPNASINSLAVIGKCCIVNTGAIIEHECQIDNFSHIAPGAVLAGNVSIGKHCLIGANAIIKQGVTIIDDVIIGAGAVVLYDITEKGTWVGTPAKLVSK